MFFEGLKTSKTVNRQSNITKNTLGKTRLARCHLITTIPNEAVLGLSWEPAFGGPKYLFRPQLWSNYGPKWPFKWTVDLILNQILAKYPLGKLKSHLA